ncbi:hypothetical protein [Paenibacillus agaridevorans]|uniref:hypothetical protein n=1 Tax=Paenibacillus agaridevorans TaxID=171404 RepID=UPI001BE472F4|nr:hypothetical protein [Paenibacillus agaridevorans]
MQNKWYSRFLEKYKKPHWMLIISLVFLVASTFFGASKLDIQAVSLIFLLSFLIHAFAQKQIYHLINLIIYGWILGILFEFYFFAALSLVAIITSALVIIHILTMRFIKWTNLEIVRNYKHSFSQVIFLVWRSLILLLIITLPIFIFMFSLSAWSNVQLPNSALAIITSATSVQSFFVILSCHGIITYFLFDYFRIFFGKLKKDNSKYSTLNFAFSLFVFLSLPDLVYTLFYYLTLDFKNIISFTGIDALSYMTKIFSFTFSIHYAMPILDGTTTVSTTLKLLSNDYELKFIQWGQIIVSKAYDLIVLATLIEYLRNRFFPTQPVQSNKRAAE